LGRIRVLSDQLINRIAAGEVVERPASVVKELVENSLDAGARSIEVRLLAGGKSRIEIRDDGDGMDRDDALLALERHATSKLAAASDLETISSLGFRGEALSSIAAVSMLTLKTAGRNGAGTEVVVHGGRIQGVREVGHPRGTTIRVERLFFNVPARRKFLRADATELAHSVRWLTRYALACPDRRFHLGHGERRIIDAEPTADPLQRIAHVYGGELAEGLLPVELRDQDLLVRGYAGRPVDALARRDAQHLFVNGRAIQDRVLTHAVTQAYENTMPPGRYPAVFLFLEMDPSALDVNVHPQKTEVRFRHSSRVHDAVRDALRGALSTGDAIPSLSDLRPAIAEQLGAVQRATLSYLETRETSAGDGLYDRDRTRPAPAPASTDERAPSVDLEPRPAQAGSTNRHAVPLAQYRSSYIVAQDASGLVLIDQHAAHERVLFERYLDEAEANAVGVQQLMFPVTIELAPHEAVLAEQEIEEFERLGFSIEPFGEQVVRLSGIPAIGDRVDPAALFRELLGEAAQAKAATSDSSGLRRRLVTTAACHAAIKINHPLTLSAMQALLDDLYATRSQTTCPHGRPVLFRLTTEEIERAFRRR
jgi:DNA mismatch repair protein MutL